MTAEVPLPERIGRYPVERLLGRGAMGSVYLARDTELDRDVAIKTVRMPTHPDEQASFLVRFRNEARAVGRLRHASVISVYDVGHDAQHGPFLVFEYVEGSTLKEILQRKGPLSRDQLLALAEQVCGALDAAHREGIIHRDIKPDNLLVGRDGMVRLADFGVARVPDAALTGEGQFLGTPCYGAPETLQSGASTPLSDQFSFAAVLYEAVSGVRAFPGTDAIAVAHSVIHDEPRPPSRVALPGAEVPGALDPVILRGLSKLPGQRYESLSTLLAELTRAYGLSVLPTSPSSKGPRTGPIVLGSVGDDTVPAIAGRSSRPPAPRSSDKKALPLWPFALATVLGVGAAVQLAPRAPAASVAPAVGEGVTEGTVDAHAQDVKGSATPPPEPGKVDAGALAAAQLADANIQALPDPATLSAFEREERAKDALERVQRALDSGDKEGAKKALDEAFRYDPEHPDIAALRRKL